MNKKLIRWLLSDDVGLSSKAIVAYMTDTKYERQFFAPCDGGDRGRCIRLLQLFPEWFDRIDEMKKLSPQWDKQIDLIKSSMRII